MDPVSLVRDVPEELLIRPKHAQNVLYGEPFDLRDRGYQHFVTANVLQINKITLKALAYIFCSPEDLLEKVNVGGHERGHIGAAVIDQEKVHLFLASHLGG
jgi:hypothetical protein